jgi:hypothetical protein
MPDRDPHKWPNRKPLMHQQDDGLHWHLVETRWSKAETSRTLHVAQTSFWTMQLGYADFLQMFGFRRSPCQLLSQTTPECVWREVPHDFDLSEFRKRAHEAIWAFRRADEKLRPSGLSVALPIASLTHGSSGYCIREPMPAFAGDGHDAEPAHPPARVEDDHFRFLHYCFTREGIHGFAHHISPKVTLSPEQALALKLIGLQPQTECPFFDCEPCFWKASPGANPGEEDHRQRDEQRHMDHRRYHQHQPGQIGKGVKELLACREAMLPLGWDLFDALKLACSVGVPPSSSGRRWKYDLAISFAGAQRPIAEEFARFVQKNGLSVFYDQDCTNTLWGEHLPSRLYRVYSDEARLCLMLISREYLEREWTTLELRAGIDRLVRERGGPYILPLRCDDAPVPELLATVGHETLEQRTIEGVKTLLIERIRALT